MSERGTCNICKKSYTRSGIINHLNKCILELARYNEAKGSIKRDVYFVRVTTKYPSPYFMDILIDKDATLKLLDDFLRGIWLECCGHLSEFFIGYNNFIVDYDERASEYDEDFAYGMNYKLGDLVDLGEEIFYTYDFGSSSELKLVVKDEYVGIPMEHAVTLISRNNDVANDPYNSPRTNVCGYSGSDKFDPASLMVDNYEVVDLEADMWDEDFDEDAMEAFYSGIDVEGELDQVAQMNNMLEEFSGDDVDFYAEMEKAFRTMYEDLRNRDVKRAAKYFVSERDTSLEKCMRVFTKDELYEYSKMLGITGVSSLKKQQLLDCVLKDVSILYGLRLRMLSKIGLDILLEAANKGSVTVSREKFELVSSGDLRQFIWSTMLFPVSVEKEHDIVFLMPKEIKDSFKQWHDDKCMELAKRNTKIMNIVRGMVYYYGWIDMRNLYRLVEEFVEIDFMQLFNVIAYNTPFYTSVIEYKGGFRYAGVIEPRKLQEELARRESMFGKEEYKRFTYDELKAVKDQGYYVRSSAVIALEKELKKHYSISKSELQEFIQDLMVHMDNLADFSELIHVVESYLELPDMYVTNRIVDKLKKLYNSQRQWMLKGFSGEEKSQNSIETPVIVENTSKLNVFSDNVKVDKGPSNNVTHMDFVKKKKIGRNEKCPCGSGKKYKYCCGKNK